MKTITLFGLTVLCLLVGCNSGNSGAANTSVTSASSATRPPVEYVHFEGIWQGIVTPAASGSSLPAIVMVNGWGEFRMIAPGMQFVGFPRRTATDISGEVTGFASAGVTWNDGSRIADFVLSGTISENEFIDADYSGSADAGVLAIAWSGSDQPTEIDSIQGSWAVYDEYQNIVMTLQVEVYDRWQAQISGTHANGCMFTGNSEAWTSENLYDLVPFEVNGCPLAGDIDPNGTYSGTGALVDVEGDDTSESVLVLALSNEANQVTLFLRRLPE